MVYDRTRKTDDGFEEEKNYNIIIILFEFK